MRLVLRPEVLMKREIIEGLALSERQLEQLRDAFRRIRIERQGCGAGQPRRDRVRGRAGS